MKRSRIPVGPVLLTGLLSLYLAVACWFAGWGVPGSLQAALRWRSPGLGQPTGPVGALLAAFAAWLAGPWLRWLMPVAPWLWIPLRSPASRRAALRPLAFGAATLTALLGLLGHPALGRVGIGPRGGGWIGELVQHGVCSMVGALGGFLVLASATAWLLLRYLPGGVPSSEVDAQSLAGGVAAMARRFGAVLRALGSGSLVLGRGLKGTGARWAQRVGERASHRGRTDSVANADGQSDALRGSALDEGGAELIAVDAERSRQRWATAPLEADPEVSGAESYAGVQSSQSREASESFALPNASPRGETGAPPDLFASSEFAGDHSHALAGRLEPASAAESAAAAGAPEEQEFRLSRDPTELLRDEQAATRAARARRRGTKMKLPPVGLLDDVPKEERGFSREALQMNARLLLETLANYGIAGQINEIRPGPVVTTFEFEPAPGVKVSQITSRQDDLALAMRAVRIRIEAPIPGKAAVGIEIPNPYPQMVTLKQVMGSLLADEHAKPLAIALGKDVEGNPFRADLAEMPHLLVAGATGSGKSVCLNALVCNLLLRNGPERVRLLMIDPKMLELSVYNGIPHLLHPVITEAKEALKALRWMVEHMSVRYSKLAKHGVRNIADFNAKVRAGEVRDHEGHRVDEEMPYVVVIVDELADLMMLLGQDLETPIARLAQMARAVGIHLVLATQRPSVNVITGVIKANFPSRIAFRVISKIDSRTILDAMGAEQLLGKGDMLFLMAGWAQPQRIHGAYLNLTECERITNHWREQCDEPAKLDLDEATPGQGVLDLGEDELLDEARRVVVLAQSGSVSLLQRRLRVGYTRAARLMDMLEEQGVVGPFDGSKAREVLVGREELEAES